MHPTVSVTCAARLWLPLVEASPAIQGRAATLRFMGFLSKLFGGDAGSTSGKTDAAEAPQNPKSGETAEPSAAEAAPSQPRPSAKQEPVVAVPPEPPSRRSSLEQATPAKQAVAAGEDPEKSSKPSAEVASAVKPPAPKPAADKAAADKALRDKSLGGVAPAAKPANTNANTSKGAAAQRATVEQEPASATIDPSAQKAAVSPAGRRAPLERKKPLEESILTSAPKRPLDPAAHGGPARSAGKVAASPADGQVRDAPKSSERGSMASLEAANLAAVRSRGDRSKSPGFYSSVSPANGSIAVTGSLSNANLLKATVVGIAPPPEAAIQTKTGATPESSGVDSALLEPALRDPSLEQPALVSSGEAAPPLKAKRAAEEKEDTSPGLGNNRSRHDPAIATVLPNKDLDLLVEFILALAMGTTSETWLPPIRSAVAELRMAASHAERFGLEKSLGLFAKELDDPGALTEERRSRILKLFASVDMALPRPIDIAACKAQRERLILEQLFLEVSLIHPLIPQRLREEGVASLERLARANMDELSQRVAASSEQADQIASTFQTYLSSRVVRGPDLVILGKGRVIKERLRALEASAEDFQRVSDGEDPEARRIARRKRQAEVAQISLLLAEFGEASILSEIERCSVQGKIERLDRWLSEIDAS